MPLLSVLTAAHAGRAEFLAEAGRSLVDQELPAGWRMEWVIQEDGPAPELGPVAERFVFARYRPNGERLGIATTRNLALTRAGGTLIHVLDSDDLLLPGGLRVAIEAFEADPRIGWVAAQAYDLLPDGGRVAVPPLIPPGYLEPGAVNDYLLAHGRLPFIPAGMTLRTDITRAVGGWAANPRAEEGAMLAAITELTPGYYTPEVTWLVRLHDHRTTGQPSWRGRLLAESMAGIEQRIIALRETGVRLPR